MSTDITKPMALDLAPINQDEINQWIKEAQAYAEEQSRRLSLAVEQFEAVGIAAPVDMERANEVLTQIVAARRTVDEKWEASVAFFNKAHKTLTGWRKRGTDLFDKLRERQEKPMKAFVRKQEEEDRRRQRQAEEAAAELKKRQEAEARRLARQGDIAGAREAKEIAKAITAPVMPSTETNLGDNIQRRPWLVEVFDKMELIKAVAAGAAPIEAVKEIDLVYLKRRAAENNKEGVIYPGVKAWQDIGFSVRT